MSEHIVIIGNGIAGITAARHIRKLSKHKITVISGESDHFFSRTALMYIYMGHMKYENTKPYEDHFWPKNRIDLKRAWISSIDTQQQLLTTDQGETITYTKLILATGSKPNIFNWKGVDLKGVQGMVSLQDMELMKTNTEGIHHAVVIGGGLIGVEMSEMLHSRGIHVTHLIREKHFWNSILPTEEASMIDRHLKSRGIDLRSETELDEILGDENGRVKGIKTKSGESIECQFVGLAVGVHPNIAIAKSAGIETDRGILVDDLLQTSAPNVYALGDCAQIRTPLPHRAPIEAVWYAGRMMGETVARTITGKPTPYQPGVWFNSAKFVDIEYQTYGKVPATCPEDQSDFLWQDHRNEISLRVRHMTKDKTVTGMNVFGMRQRHEVWDQWIRQGVKLNHAIANLDQANFDPEFYKRYEGAIQAHYNDLFPGKLVKVRKPSLLEKIFN